jgi:hypothetical protein
MNTVEMKHRTTREILARLVRAGEVRQADATAILDAYAEADRILAAADARAVARAQDAGLTPEGKMREQTKDGAGLAAAFVPIRAKITAAVRAHQEFVARAPHMRRQADGTFVDVREQRGKDDAAAELLREMRDRDRRDYLRALPPAERGAVLRQIADEGHDPDDLLGAALRAPRYADILDVPTRRYLTEATLRHSGLDVALAQSQFVAARFEQLGEAIEESLAELGVPAEREAPIRL